MPYASGGGVYSTARGSLLIRNSVIAGNSASLGAGGGGGIYVDVPSHQVGQSGHGFVLENSLISGNDTTDHIFEETGGKGGGLHLLLSSTSKSLISNSTIENNIAHTGAGIYTTHEPYASGTSVEVLNSTIRGNKAGTYPNIGSSGGGILFSGLGEFIISGSTISENTSYTWGGGIYSESVEDLRIVNSTVSGNQSMGAGGGIFIHRVRVEESSRISHSTITDNEVGFDTGLNPRTGTAPTASWAIGGGLAVQGDSGTGFSTTELDHTIIAGNRDLWDIAPEDDPWVSLNPNLYAVAEPELLRTGARAVGSGLFKNAPRAGHF